MIAFWKRTHLYLLLVSPWALAAASYEQNTIKATLKHASSRDATDKRSKSISRRQHGPVNQVINGAGTKSFSPRGFYVEFTYRDTLNTTVPPIMLCLDTVDASTFVFSGFCPSSNATCNIC
jgi:hypothetical protein